MEGNSNTTPIVTVMADVEIKGISTMPYSIAFNVGNEYPADGSGYMKIRLDLFRALLGEAALSAQTAPADFVKASVTLVAVTCYPVNETPDDGEMVPVNSPIPFFVPAGLDERTVDDFLGNLRPRLQQITSYIEPAI